MKRRVSALEARRQLGQLLEGVYYRGDEVVIERAGKPMAVVIPMEQYESIERSRDRLMQMFAEAQERNKDVSVEEIERDIALAIAEVRRESRRSVTKESA